MMMKKASKGIVRSKISDLKYLIEQARMEVMKTRREMIPQMPVGGNNPEMS